MYDYLNDVRYFGENYANLTKNDVKQNKKGSLNLPMYISSQT